MSFLDLSSLGQTALPAPKGYGTDPNLLLDYSPGDLWPLTLKDTQRISVSRLSDFFIPADDQSPSASSLGVHDFIDEWISAPYPSQQKDRRIILDGLSWIEDQCMETNGQAFSRLDSEKTQNFCKQLIDTFYFTIPTSIGSQFLKRVRELTAIGYYTTPEGMKDLGYVGNTPLAAFKGPPSSILEKLK